jgi:hypothetical protein
MFELPKDFDKDAELSIITKDTRPFHEGDFVVIIGGKSKGGGVSGGELIGGWQRRDDTLFLRETTYKHYKRYTDGSLIDLIQKLSHHNLATWDAGCDEDQDCYWEVSFQIADFKDHRAAGN